MKTKNFVVTGCQHCPNLKLERIAGAGYAQDYICGATGYLIKGYVEWSSEAPRDGEFPKSCPLKTTKKTTKE